MRDFYKKRFDEREAALIQRIRDAEANAPHAHPLRGGRRAPGADRRDPDPLQNEEVRKAAHPDLAKRYAAAKAHFEAALEALQAAGKTLKDLFKFLIHNFGAGIRPYAVPFGP